MVLKNTILSLLLFSSFLIFAQQTDSALKSKIYYKLDKSIEYRESKSTSLDEYATKLCRLDLYYPINQKNFTTVVWFHGGGLTDGEKEIPEKLMEEGFAVVAVGYRKSPHVKSELIIDDAASALAWVFENISEYGGDNSKIILAGYSAGAYLALMLSMDKTYLNDYQIDANKLLAIVALSPQTITHFAFRNERGIKGIQPVVDKFAPLFHVRADLPPLLLLTGDRELEMWGRYEENAYLKRMLNVNGHNFTTLYELAGFDHLGMFDPAMSLTVKFISSFNNQN